MEGIKSRHEVIQFDQSLFYQALLDDWTASLIAFV
jgi:hypothetical protein